LFDFIISDLHLGETRMEIMQRPYVDDCAMFVDIRAKHNKLVQPHQKVLIVGDIVSKSAPDREHWLSQVSLLNGHKTLIRGNHDEPFTTEQLLSVFDEVIPEGDGIEFDVRDDAKNRIIACYATHYPTQGRVDRFNIVGHIHSAWKYQKNMLNVCVDVHHFAPIPIVKIPFYLTAIESFYDDDVWVADNPINATYNDSRGKKGTYFSKAVV
jgi:calcineurin-like phosphoesterase family protein